MPPQILTSGDGVTSLACDALIVGAHSGDDGFTLESAARALDDALGGHLTEALRAAGFKGKPGEMQIVPTLGRLPAAAVGVAGLGAERPAAASQVRRAAGSAARRLSERHELASMLHDGVAGGARAAAEGFLLGSYRFAGYSSRPRAANIERILMPGAEAAEIERGSISAEAVAFARDLTNEPADVLTPGALAERARAAAEVAGLECTVLDAEGLREGGYGGIVAVGKGSAHPPRLIRLHYRSQEAGTGESRLVVVGKGITYDSGGLTIKPPASMAEMKTDMGGGAAAIAAAMAVPKLGIGAEIIAYVPCAENMIGPASMRPGDVIHHYGGRTTEMVNADAEGRLVLGDALARATEDDPDAVVDIATLTSSISIALGKKVGGLFATHDDLAGELTAAGDKAGERWWRMPLVDDYVADLDSEIADAKNSGGRPGGAVLAALFLRSFVGNGVPWAHLDIAGTGRADADTDEGPKGATGFGTRTLIDWIEARSG